MDSNPIENTASAQPAQKNPLFPVFLKLENLRTLLVGAGNVGLEKLHALLANSPRASITIVAPDINDEIRKLVYRHPSCTIVQRKFEISDLEEKEVAILATDDKSLHES